MRETFIRFTAPIVPEGVDALLDTLDNEVRGGAERIHLLLSSPGGSVQQGILATNYMRALPVELHTYNLGAVDSICAVVFSAGSRRTSAPQSRFLLHPVCAVPNGGLSASALAEKIAEIESDTNQVLDMLTEASGANSRTLFTDAMTRRAVISPHQAVEMGLTHDIALPAIARSNRILAIGNDVTVRRDQRSPES